MNPSSLKYILFDNDGVLVETEKWYFRANAEILQEMNIHLDEKRYLEIMVKGQSAFILAQEEGYDSHIIEEYRDKRNTLYQHYIATEDIEIEGVKEVLHALKEKYNMAIITSSRREDFELIHAKRGIREYMDFELCSGEYKRSKPHPDPYIEGLKRFNATKEEAIVVEDSQRGLESAYRAGIECVIVHNHFTTSHDFSNATHKIQTLNELHNLLS